MGMLELPRGPVHYEVSGAGPDVVLLHGGLADATSWAPQRPALSARFRVWVPERRGHGRTPDRTGPWSYDDMAAETIEVLEALVGGPAHLVGWSDGAIVGLLVALERPDLVDRLVLLGANFHHEGLVPGAVDGPDDDPSGPSTAAERAAHATRSPDGPGHWPALFRAVAGLWQREPELTVADLARVRAPTLVLVGDDEPIELAHTCALYEGLPEGQLAVVPGASHLVAAEKPELVNRLIVDFLLESGPPRTAWPVRRARPPRRPEEAGRDGPGGTGRLAPGEPATEGEGDA